LNEILWAEDSTAMRVKDRERESFIARVVKRVGSYNERATNRRRVQGKRGLVEGVSTDRECRRQTSDCGVPWIVCIFDAVGIRKTDLFFQRALSVSVSVLPLILIKWVHISSTKLK
jgi:hypothetical protein